MIQFYFLSILLNFLAGYALSFDRDAHAGKLEGVRELFRDETLRLVLGVLTISVGFFKMLSAVRGDVPIIGDLYPAAAGLLAGFALILEYYRSKTTLHVESSDKLDLVFVKNRKWVGVCAIVASVSHFLFPTVLFF
ncbi:MAG: hypothetical protein WCT14_03765 [Treponemataceae bacterium]